MAVVIQMFDNDDPISGFFDGLSQLCDCIGFNGSLLGLGTLLVVICGCVFFGNSQGASNANKGVAKVSTTSAVGSSSAPLLGSGNGLKALSAQSHPVLSKVLNGGKKLWKARHTLN